MEKIHYVVPVALWPARMQTLWTAWDNVVCAKLSPKKCHRGGWCSTLHTREYDPLYGTRLLVCSASRPIAGLRILSMYPFLKLNWTELNETGHMVYHFWNWTELNETSHTVYRFWNWNELNETGHMISLHFVCSWSRMLSQGSLWVGEPKTQDSRIRSHFRRERGKKRSAQQKKFRQAFRGLTSAYGVYGSVFGSQVRFCFSSCAAPVTPALKRSLWFVCLHVCADVKSTLQRFSFLVSLAFLEGVFFSNFGHSLHSYFFCLCFLRGLSLGDGGFTICS